MNFIYGKWDDVPIAVYKEICGITESDASDTEKTVSLIAVLCGVPEDEVWALPLTEVGVLAKSIGWVFNFGFDTAKKPHKLRLPSGEYSVEYDVSKMSIAAYVDFQNYFKDRKRFMGALLTTFVIPKGHKYAEGYDCAVLAKTFENEVPITTYNTLLYFFVLTSLNSIRAMQIYSALMLSKAMKNGSLTEAEREKIMKKMAELKSATDMFGCRS